MGGSAPAPRDSVQTYACGQPACGPTESAPPSHLACRGHPACRDLATMGPHNASGRSGSGRGSPASCCAAVERSGPARIQAADRMPGTPFGAPPAAVFRHGTSGRRVEEEHYLLGLARRRNPWIAKSTETGRVLSPRGAARSSQNAGPRSGPPGHSSVRFVNRPGGAVRWSRKNSCSRAPSRSSRGSSWAAVPSPKPTGAV